MKNFFKKFGVILFMGVVSLTFVLSLSAYGVEEKAKEAEKMNVFKEAEMRKKVKEVVEATLQIARPEKKAIKIYEGPVDPRRLFIIPVADVLGSMELNLGGGTSFGVRKTEKSAFLGHVRLGLGNVAEVEVSTLGIINQLAEGTAYIPTASFKLKFIPEGKWYPSIAGALRSSLWHTEERGIIKFQKRVSTLYFVASKTFGSASFHGGVSINDLRIRTRTSTDGYISPTLQQAEESDKDYFNRNLFGPFFGLKVEVNPRTFLMMELEQVAKYKFKEDNPLLSSDDISTEWMLISGIRFFFFDWLALDAGVMYRSDFHGIGDAQIEAGLNINLPLPRIIRAMRESF